MPFLVKSSLNIAWTGRQHLSSILFDHCTESPFETRCSVFIKSQRFSCQSHWDLQGTTVPLVPPVPMLHKGKHRADRDERISRVWDSLRGVILSWVIWFHVQLCWNVLNNLVSIFQPRAADLQLLKLFRVHGEVNLAKWALFTNHPKSTRSQKERNNQNHQMIWDSVDY